jgi:hypothetical protein
MIKTATPRKKFSNQLKIADMVSLGGAGLIGLGLGAGLNEHMVGVVPAVILIGLVLHGLGMFGKFQVEREHINPPAWVIGSFMICWMGLMIVAFYVLIGRYLVVL